MMKKFILGWILISLLITRASAQNFSAAIGTDIPYQHYAAINLELKNVDFSYRSGILIAPYSEAILGILEGFGTDEVYINLLDASFDFGWMNSLGAYYKFGSKKLWYAGVDVRFDFLTASDTPQGLIESVSGQSVNRTGLINREIQLQLGLRTAGVGLRFGRSFALGSNNRHYLKCDLSVIKHISSATTLKGNWNNLELINQEIDRLIWEEVFRTFGYLGGVGVSYVYKF